MVRRHKGIIVVILLAFFLRLLVVFFATQFRENPDVLRYKDWGRISFLYGPADTYTSNHLSFGTYSNNQPPGSLYVISSMYWVWLQAGKLLSHAGVAPGSSPWVNVILLQMILRFPSVLVDIGIGLIVYAFVYRFSKKQRLGIISSSVFLFNPAVIYNSAFWGQMDAINNFFGLFALWLLTNRRYFSGILSFICSLCVKFSLIFASPFIVLLLVMKQKHPTRMVVLAVGVCIFVGTVIVFPISRAPLSWWWLYITHNATGEMTNITAFAFNFWWVVFHPHLVFGSSADLTKVVDISLVHDPLTQTMYGRVSLGLLAIGISLLMQAPVYWWFLRKVRGKKEIPSSVMISAFAMLSLISYITLPQMHERYMYPAFAPLAILLGFGVPVFWELVLLSLSNVVNLVIVWHPMPLPPWVFDSMRSVSVQWWVALFTTILGFWTIGKIIRFRKNI